MKNTILLIIISLLFILPQTINASHVMGGEITWKCIRSGPNTGKYIFSLKSYCVYGGGIIENTQTLASNSPAGNIPMTLVSGYPVDISPVCNSAYPQITGAGIMSECLYESAAISLNGIPPTGGWTFYWISGNRNPTNNINGSQSMKIRVKMYAYNNTNASICFDNSPEFANKIKTALKSGSPFYYTDATYDSDLDSLSFEWGQPITDNGTALTYQTGYSYTSPLPDTSINPNNIGATIDPQTGLISLLSYTTGAFLTNVKVSSYRNNQLIAEVWREIRLVILPGDTNLPPTVSLNLNNNIIRDTVESGETKTFSINAQDISFLPNGVPQTMYLNAQGQQFGNYILTTGAASTYDSLNGCPQIPCATLTPAPNDTTPISGVFGIQTNFNWRTNCSHLSNKPDGSQGPKTYSFNFNIRDDYCPIPAENNFIYSLTVVPTNSSNLKTEIKSVNVLQNGNINIKWSPIVDTNNYFIAYNLYQAFSANGPFILIDSITNVNIGSYTISSTSTATKKYYKITTHQTNCANFQGFSTSLTFKNIILNETNINNCITKLTWNNTTADNSYFIIKRKYNNLWSIIDSTTNLHYTDTFSSTFVDYMIETPNSLITDSLGNIYYTMSTSNIKHKETSIDIGSDTSICDNESLLININSGFDTYQWYNSITNNWILIHGSDFTIGDHNIWLKADMTYGCEMTDSFVLTVVDCTSSLEENTNNLSFDIFPNPSSGKFTLDIKSIDTKYLLIEAISIDGKVVYYQEVNITNKETSINMDISGNAAGSYIIRISNDKYNYQKSIKLLK